MKPLLPGRGERPPAAVAESDRQKLPDGPFALDHDPVHRTPARVLLGQKGRCTALRINRERQFEEGHEPASIPSRNVRKQDGRLAGPAPFDRPPRLLVQCYLGVVRGRGRTNMRPVEERQRPPCIAGQNGIVEDFGIDRVIRAVFDDGLVLPAVIAPGCKHQLVRPDAIGNDDAGAEALEACDSPLRERGHLRMA